MSLPMLALCTHVDIYVHATSKKGPMLWILEDAGGCCRCSLFSRRGLASGSWDMPGVILSEIETGIRQKESHQQHG